MSSIKISKIAYGSLSTIIGDGAIGYTSEVSDRAREVDGIYVDVPPVLSRNYSSLIWRYYKDTDNHMLTHVQGSHVENASMDRVYSYRGAYEVSRTEMQRNGYNVASVLDSMPRIRQYEAKETWSEDTELIRHKSHGNPAVINGLRQLICYAVHECKPLYISIPTTDRTLRGNGVFASPEWNNLIEAVDSLDMAVRRYASFAFCVDRNYARQLSDVLIIVYARESDMPIPQGAISLRWEDIKPVPGADAALRDTLTIMRTMPGESDRMLTLSEMFQRMQAMKQSLSTIRSKQPVSFTPDEYSLWLLDGHTPSELRADSWTGLAHLLSLNATDSAVCKTIAANHKSLTDELARNGFANEKVLSSVHTADDCTAWVEQYKGILDPHVLSAAVATLDIRKDLSLIEQILETRRNNATGKIIKTGLDILASRKAQEIGTSVEKWMKYLSTVKGTDSQPLPKCRALVLSQVNTWDERSRDTLIADAVRYASSNPKRLADERFALIVKSLKIGKAVKPAAGGNPRRTAHSGKTGKSGNSNTPCPPSNPSKFQDNNMADLNQDTPDSLDRLYEEVLQAQKKKKNKKVTVFSVLAFLAGIVLTAAAALILWPAQEEELQTAEVADIPASTVYSLLATQQTDTLRVEVCQLDTAGVRLDSLRDTLVIAPGSTLLEPCFQKPYIIERILQGDSIVLDVKEQK